MDGKKYHASELIYNLRINLFKEHFGLESEEFIDPLDDKMWDFLIGISKVIFIIGFFKKFNFTSKNLEKYGNFQRSVSVLSRRRDQTYR